METFGLIGNEFINLYSEENPLLEVNDTCYFLFTNNNDYHRPLMGKGLIISDRFNDGMNKIYYIRLLEILESPKIVTDFIFNKPFWTYTFINNSLSTKKLVKPGQDFDFSSSLLKVTSFFVRLDQEKLNQLRMEYIAVIKKDILNQLKDIEAI